MAFRVVDVAEVRTVACVGGSMVAVLLIIAERAGVDRKTARRYVEGTLTDRWSVPLQFLSDQTLAR